jgi:hypothetical protein
VLGGVSLFACGSGRDSGFDDGANPGGTNANDGKFGGGGDAGPAGKPCVPNPANYDIPGNNCDDDGDGKVDNPPTCDDGLSAGGSADEFAKSLGVCTKASDKGYGLVSAKFTRGFNRNEAPQTDQHGILPKFGSAIKPREGGSLGVLSTGYAREYNGAGKEPFGGVTKGATPISPPTFHGKDWYNFAGQGRQRKRASGVPEACGGLQAGERRQRRHHREARDEGAAERERHQVRLQLLLGRVARLRLLPVQRRLHRLSHREGVQQRPG